MSRCQCPPSPPAYLVYGVERHEGAQLGVKIKVPDDLLEGPKPAQGLKVGQGHGHLGLVVVVRVNLGAFGVKPLRELLVRMRLFSDSRSPEVVSGSYGLH